MFVHSSILFLLIWSITGLTANAQPAEGDLEIVPIDNVADLVKNIDRDNVWLVLAPTSTDNYDDPSLDGLYVLSPCNGGGSSKSWETPRADSSSRVKTASLVGDSCFVWTKTESRDP